MKIDMEKMSAEELKSLIADAEKALKTLETRRKAEAKLAAEKVAKEYGFSLEEVLKAAPATKASKGAPKYAHPENPSMTWTGRGRKPNWVNDALAQGKTLDDLLI